MVHLVDNVSLKPELLGFPNLEFSGGGWPLEIDMLENWAWFNGAFTEPELNAIINIGTNNKLHQAGTYGGSDPKIRSSFVQFLFPCELTSWIFTRLAAVINKMNNDFFQFDLFAMEQGLQFTQYSAPGEHYDWHIDRGMQTAPRKLSLVMQLTDPSEYVGGDLQLWFGGEPITAPKERGSITLFPSYVMHRVQPVTEGRRHSLVCWVSGPRFK